MAGLVIPSNALQLRVNSFQGHHVDLAYLLAAICAINDGIGAISGVGASTPVSTQVNVPETAGGTTLAAAVAEGQFVEIANNGDKTVYLRISGNPTVTLGVPLPPGAVYTTPTRITTAIKGITAAGETSLVTITRFP